MNLFHSYTFTWWQVGILKLTVLCVGLAAGAYWSAFFIPLIPYLLILAIILGLCLLFVVSK